MSRQFCPSTSQKLRPLPKRATSVDESITRVLQQTSDFDRVCQRYHSSTLSPSHHRLKPIPGGLNNVEARLASKRLVVSCPVDHHHDESDTCKQKGDDGDIAAPKLQSSFGAHVHFNLMQDEPLSPSNMREACVSLSPILSSPKAVAKHSEQDSEHYVTGNTEGLPNYTHEERYPFLEAATAQVVTSSSPYAPPKADASVFFPQNRRRLRNYMQETSSWSQEYTAERRRFERLTDVEMSLEYQSQCTEWRSPPVLVSSGRRSPVRPGDSIAQNLEEKKKEMQSRFLSKVRLYMVHVEGMMEVENDEKRKAAEQSAIARRRQSEWAAQHPFAAGGVLDRTFSNIASVAEQKYSSLTTRYYNIAYRHRQHDIDLKEIYIVKLEHTTFKLGSVMTYNEFICVYRQFHRYAAPNPFLVIAQLPKHGWVFVDKVIKALITRKIDKNKSGKIQLPDLLKHLFPAMTMQEITDAIPVYERQYLQFSDKTVRLYLDSLEPDKVNHFGVVFSIVDKQGNGKVLRQEFVDNMPIDKESKDEEEQIKLFLGELFDAHARRDMNEKMEYIGDPYLDLDGLGSALSIPRYNAYGGTVMK